jgi:uncharacterized protein (TIRG00374 family)
VAHPSPGGLRPGRPRPSAALAFAVRRWASPPDWDRPQRDGVGYLFNNILPARAGEAARVVVLTQRSAASPVEIVATVVLERVYDVVAILVIFFVAEPWLPHVAWFGAAAVAAIVLAGAIVAVVAGHAIYGDRPVFLLLRPLRRFSPFSGPRLDRTVEEVTHGLSGLRSRTVAVQAFLWTLAAWMVSAVCAYIVTLSFHLHLSFATAVLVIVAVGLSMILPSPPGAIGVFEGAALIALKAYGISHSSALPYALVLHAVNFLPFLLVGPFLLQYNMRHPRRGRVADEHIRPRSSFAPRAESTGSGPLQLATQVLRLTKTTMSWVGRAPPGRMSTTRNHRDQ